MKTATVFLSDLSRALPIAHNLDFIALAGYEGNGGGGGRVRLLKDLTLSIKGRDVLLVEDVVDTGMTLNFLVKTLALREPSSLAAVALLDRPYRRLVENLPGPVRRLHRAGRVLRRLRIRPGRPLAQPSGPPAASLKRTTGRP